MPLKRDISNVASTNGHSPRLQNGHLENGHTSLEGSVDDDEHEVLDMVIVGAGFAGIYLLHKLRQQGFRAKIVEVKRYTI